ncbi:MAG TPA: FadR family transcriptional regulator, partial [Firmicutes bacterium]|nr:FadR family transcriptional regulator [Bacillota bacterium]
MQLFQPIGHKRAYLQIIEQIKALLRDGRLRPGDRLPSERLLAQQLNASRASVREALSAMELAGLVYSRKGSGTYISEEAMRISAAISPDLERLASDSGPVEIIRAREVVEAGLAELAALNASAEDIAAMEEANRVLRERLSLDPQPGREEPLEEY